MAVTRVTHSVSGFNAINYALDGKPHVSNQYISNRVLTSSGINCTVHGCRQQMNAVWKRYGINRPTKRHRRQVQRLIQSFDPYQLSYKRLNNVVKANEIGRSLASKLYPYRQSIVVTQADNQHHILHNHIITNMLDFRTGKSMTGKQTSWPHIQAVSDSVIRSYGLDPTANKLMARTRQGQTIPYAPFHQTDAEYHIKKRGAYSWVNDIRDRVNRALSFSVNWNDLIQHCRQNGVLCTPYRKHKGGIRRDKTGAPVFKKYTSFRFKGQDKKIHRIRDRKLGLLFTHSHVDRTFQYNINRQQREAQAKASAQKRAVAASKASSASYSALVSMSASISKSASISASASVSFAPVRQRNYSASISRSNAAKTYSNEMSAINQHSVASLSAVQNIALRPEWASLTNRFSNMLTTKRYAKASERKRVLSYMPQFHSRKAQRYAWWHYGHVIPAQCVGYDGRIPKFSVNRKDKGLLHKLTYPIVNGFRCGKNWILDKWHSGKNAVNNYIHRHHIKITKSWYVDPDGVYTGDSGYPNHKVTAPMNIVDMAQDAKHSFIHGFVHTAKRFHRAWSNIKSSFHRKFIQPIMSRFNHASNSASSANSARERALIDRSQATSFAKASATNAMTTAVKTKDRAMIRISNESYGMSVSSYDKTSAGKAENISYINHENSFTKSVNKSFASKDSARSQSVSASKSASSSASKASWTSSVANFSYSSWLSIDDSFFDRNLDSSQRDVPSYKMNVITNMGYSKHCKYNGVNNSHKKNNVYRNATYYQKNVSFNKYCDLIRQDFKRSQSDDEKIQRAYGISRDDGHGIE